ncbi:hypothetical protein [Streptomyces graminilatus]|uniref:hypothetical protein n=1 Tax=Streptomyces graminilatus TaxID=1464070 RepID=UPI0006E2FEC7|nr:hypothetical protein [Streptomyces graminilatus]
MPKYETPRNERGERICQQCHDPDKPLRRSLGTKPVIYCSPACKQKAYENRRMEKAIVAAVAEEQRRAAAREGKSVPLPGKVTDAPKVSDVHGADRPDTDAKSVALPLPGMGHVGALPSPAAEDPGAELDRRLARWLGPEEGAGAGGG